MEKRPFQVPAVLIIALPIFGPSTTSVALVALCAHQHTQLRMPKKHFDNTAEK